MSAARRVAHLLPWDGVGGTEHATLRIARAVAPAGWTSVAFCLDSAPPVEAFFRDAGVETARWHLRHPVVGHVGAFAREVRALARELARRRIDLVHCADVRAASTAGAAAARLAGIPVLCHVRNRNALPWRPSRRMLGLVDRFLFVSRDTWRQFGRAVPPGRGEVLYDGIALPADDVGAASDRAAVRAELGIAADAPLVGMIARVERQKDFRTLARATARVVAAVPEARVVVVGGTGETAEQREHFPEVQGWMAEAGVTDRVIFAGYRTDMDRLLRAMDVFLLTTHWEGLPLVLLEAMAHGLPVVATAVDGVPEAVRDGETGYLVPHADDARAADRLLALLRDPALRRRLGDAGRRVAADEFGPGQFARNLARVYDATAGAARAPGAT